jgi:WD40 repeat protein
VAISPDNQLFASGSCGIIVRLWDVTTGAPHDAPEGHLSWIEAMAFSPDGQLLASGSDDDTVMF